MTKTQENNLCRDIGRIARSLERIASAVEKTNDHDKVEIVQCKDCKHRDPEDKKCDCGHDIQWQLPRQDNWYCADAERREVTE